MHFPYNFELSNAQHTFDSFIHSFIRYIQFICRCCTKIFTSFIIANWTLKRENENSYAKEDYFTLDFSQFTFFFYVLINTSDQKRRENSTTTTQFMPFWLIIIDTFFLTCYFFSKLSTDLIDLNNLKLLLNFFLNKVSSIFNITWSSLKNDNPINKLNGLLRCPLFFFLFSCILFETNILAI